MNDKEVTEMNAGFWPSVSKLKDPKFIMFIMLITFLAQLVSGQSQM